tara:strand:+ start:4116 stop:5114 length:999 start_codon:yes stop_codon:yes gene_type:complete
MTIFKDRVAETSITTGTGSLLLAGALTRNQAFVTAHTNGDLLTYVIQHEVLNEWEVGKGSFTAPDTLIRTSVEDGSQGVGIKVAFSPGNKTVFTASSSADLNAFLLTTGDTMTGNLNMSLNLLINPQDPTDGAHVGDRNYNDNRYINTGGDTMSGNLSIGNNTLLGLADPTDPTHVGDRGYNDNRYINTSGDTMSGDLSIGNNTLLGLADPTNDAHVGDRGYNDNRYVEQSSIGSTVQAFDAQLSTLSGLTSTQTGYLTAQDQSVSSTSTVNFNEIIMAGPVTLQSYTVAGVPTASSFTGAMIFVSDETGGSTPAFSDGSNWLRVSDRAIIS